MNIQMAVTENKVLGKCRVITAHAIYSEFAGSNTAFEIGEPLPQATLTVNAALVNDIPVGTKLDVNIACDLSA